MKLAKNPNSEFGKKMDTKIVDTKTQSTDRELTTASAWERQLRDRYAFELSRAPTSGPPWLKTKAKNFLLGDDVVAPSLRCVVLDHTYENAFYPNRYTPGFETAPVCWALAEYENGLAPSEACPEPQNATCDGCMNNEFETTPSGATRKACRNSIRVGLLIISADGSEFLPALLRLPPSSIKNFKAFVSKTLQLFRLPPCGVACTLGFDKAPTYSKFVFTNVEKIADPKLISVLSSFDYAGLRQTLLRGFETAVAKAARAASTTEDAEAGTAVESGSDDDIPF
jgi:hypothetical protein